MRRNGNCFLISSVWNTKQITNYALNEHWTNVRIVIQFSSSSSYIFSWIFFKNSRTRGNGSISYYSNKMEGLVGLNRKWELKQTVGALGPGFVDCIVEYSVSENGFYKIQSFVLNLIQLFVNVYCFYIAITCCDLQQYMWVTRTIDNLWVTREILESNWNGGNQMVDTFRCGTPFLSLFRERKSR